MGKIKINSIPIKKPWERRLKDLSKLLHNCSSSYFDPDLFRMNTNQFLQTSRTITFIIQKNKSCIPNYQSWYEENVLNRWKEDEVMQWAKNSRNTIEKVGDLEMFSSLTTTLLFSYLEEEDIEIKCGRNELVGYGTKKLIRFAQKNMPTGVSDAAAVKIERKWVVTSLSSWELLHALSYVYTRVYECCQLLGEHIQSPIDSKIPDKGSSDLSRERARMIQYVKLRGFETHHITSKSIRVDPGIELPEHLQKVFHDSKYTSSSPKTLMEAVQLYSKIAEATFCHFGNHKPMLFMFNDCWKILDMVSTAFEDQVDKFIFWRTMSDRVATQKVYAVVWISEAWNRNAQGNMHLPIRNMPISGEILHVVGIDKNNNRKSITWDIVRNDDREKPKLVELLSKENKLSVETPFYLVPILRRMGVTDEQIFSNGRNS
jgi:hypothetical protein